MKNIFLLFIVGSFSFLSVFADINIWQEIEKDEINKESYQESSGLKLRRLTTNDDVKKVLIDKILEHFDVICSKFYSYRPIPFPLEKGGMMLETLEGLQGAKDAVEFSQSNISSDDKVYSKIEYSETNIQKEGVDEPDIFKNLGSYVFYYNKKNHKVYIIKNTLEDISKSKIVETINVPLLIKNVKILNTSNRLILMGTRSSRWGLVKPRTDILIFDISDLSKVRLVAFYDIKGDFFDARLIKDKLYVISKYDFNQILYTICNKRWYKPLKGMKTFSHLFQLEIKDDKLKKLLRDNLDKYKKDIKNELEDVVSNKSIYLFHTKKSNLKIKGKFYPFYLGVKDIKPANIYYIPADFEKIDSLDFNVIGIFDVENPRDNFNQYFIWGNLKQGQIHMTKKSIYLVNNYYRYHSWRCPPGLYCIMPIFKRGNFTLIHKLNLNGFDLDYVNTAVVPGRPINQYSMDEDVKGNFRIFTKYYYPQKATDLYIFDSGLTLIGELVNIAPGEEFKSSRFIEDKAFLVTFKATDPLFVIDLNDPADPEIVGELKIPGYSLYLHPLYKFENVWYLLGVGQEAKEVYGNWSLPKNIKIDIYEVDFGNNSLENEWKEVNFQEVNLEDKVVHSGVNFKDKTYVYSGDILRIFVSKNCCNTYIDILTDGNGDYKVQIVYTGIICRCFKPVMLEVKTNLVRNVAFEEIDSTEQNVEEVYNKIKIKQLYSYILGKETEYKNGGSYTPVFDNPRVFVIRYDKVKKGRAYIYLPVYLVEDVKEERCYPIYKRMGGERQLVREECNDYIKKQPYFIGVKALQIDKDEGIKEIVSKNWIDKVGKVFQWEYKNQMHRVGYVNQFVFEISNLFYDIFNEELDKFIKF